MRFRDQVVWVTGASAGIGEALAHAFAGEGASLILSARRSERLEALRAACPRPDEVLVLAVDLCDPEAREAAARDALAWKGRLDVLVNNAGVTHGEPAWETPMADFRRVMELNFFAPVALCRTVVPAMIAAGRGHVVNVSSVTGYVAPPGRSAYGASKHALQGYSDTLRAELHGTGVRVTVVCPGYVDTEIRKLAGMGDATPGGSGMVTPAKVAEVTLRGIARRSREVVVGGRETYAIYLKRFFPGLVARLLPRVRGKG